MHIHPKLDISIIRSLVTRKRVRSHSHETIIMRSDPNRHVFARLIKTLLFGISICKELFSNSSILRKVLFILYFMIC